MGLMLGSREVIKDLTNGMGLDFTKKYLVFVFQMIENKWKKNI
jgi:hypothetical protein